MKLAPIAVFVYNRPNHTYEVLKCLSENLLASESELFIFSDEAKCASDSENVIEVRKITQKFRSKFLKVNYIYNKKNKGMYNSLIEGLEFIFKSNDSVIFLEDDVLTSTKFLSFLNGCLEKYKNFENIFTVSAYNYPLEKLKLHKYIEDDIFTIQRYSSWGFAIWRDRWRSIIWDMKHYDKFILDRKLLKKYKQTGADKVKLLQNHLSGKNLSFGIILDLTMFLQKAFSIHPVHSFTNNIGNDGSGLNCFNESLNKYNSEELNEGEFILPLQPNCNDYIVSRFLNYQKKMHLNNLLKYYFKKLLRIYK